MNPTHAQTLVAQRAALARAQIAVQSARIAPTTDRLIAAIASLLTALEERAPTTEDQK